MSDGTSPFVASGLFLLESWRSFHKWRSSKRSTLFGRFGIFAAHFVTGLFVAQLFRAAVGAESSFLTTMLSLCFALGTALSGPIVFLIWSGLFIGVAGSIMGLTLGVWPYSSVWWTEALAQWRSGAPVPSVVVGAFALACLVWVAVAVGVARIRDGVLMRLVSSLIQKLRNQSVGLSVEEARMRALPSDEEAARIVNAVDDDGEGMVVRSITKRAEFIPAENTVVEVAVSGHDLTDEFLNSSVDLGGDLDGLMSADDVRSAVKASSQPTAISEPGGTPLPPVMRAPSNTKRRYILRNMIAAFEHASANPDRATAFERFNDTHSNVIMTLCDEDIGFLEDQSGTEGLMTLIHTMRGNEASVSIKVADPSSMFGIIEEPAKVTEAIAAAVPVKTDDHVASILADDLRTRDLTDAEPNADAYVETPAASGSIALSNILALALQESAAIRDEGTSPPLKPVSMEDFGLGDVVADDGADAVADVKPEDNAPQEDAASAAQLSQTDKMNAYYAAHCSNEAVEAVVAPVLDMEAGGSEVDEASTMPEQRPDDLEFQPVKVVDDAASASPSEEPLDNFVSDVEANSDNDLIQDETVAADAPTEAPAAKTENVEEQADDVQPSMATVRKLFDRLPEKMTPQDWIKAGLVTPALLEEVRMSFKFTTVPLGVALALKDQLETRNLSHVQGKAVRRIEENFGSPIASIVNSNDFERIFGDAEASRLRNKKQHLSDNLTSSPLIKAVNTVEAVLELSGRYLKNETLSNDQMDLLWNFHMGVSKFAIEFGPVMYEDLDVRANFKRAKAQLEDIFANGDPRTIVVPEKIEPQTAFDVTEQRLGLLSGKSGSALKAPGSESVLAKRRSHLAVKGQSLPHPPFDDDMVTFDDADVPVHDETADEQVDQSIVNLDVAVGEPSSGLEGLDADLRDDFTVKFAQFLSDAGIGSEIDIFAEPEPFTSEHAEGSRLFKVAQSRYASRMDELAMAREAHAEFLAEAHADQQKRNEEKEAAVTDNDSDTDTAANDAAANDGGDHAASDGDSSNLVQASQFEDEVQKRISAEERAAKLAAEVSDLRTAHEVAVKQLAEANAERLSASEMKTADEFAAVVAERDDALRLSEELKGKVADLPSSDPAVARFSTLIYPRLATNLLGEIPELPESLTEVNELLVDFMLVKRINNNLRAVNGAYMQDGDRMRSLIARVGFAAVSDRLKHFSTTICERSIEILSIEIDGSKNASELAKNKQEQDFLAYFETLAKSSMANEVDAIEHEFEEFFVAVDVAKRLSDRNINNVTELETFLGDVAALRNERDDLTREVSELRDSNGKLSAAGHAPVRNTSSRAEPAPHVIPENHGMSLDEMSKEMEGLGRPDRKYQFGNNVRALGTTAYFRVIKNENAEFVIWIDTVDGRMIMKEPFEALREMDNLMSALNITKFVFLSEHDLSELLVQLENKGQMYSIFAADATSQGIASSLDFARDRSN